MKVVVFGLGHLGSVTVAGLLRDGHSVIGVDTNQEVLDGMGRRELPFREPGLAELIADGVGGGRLQLRSNIGDAIDADFAFVCVSTRSLTGGALDLSEMKAVAGELGRAARRRPMALAPLLLVFCSTVIPGSMRDTILPLIAASASEPPGARYDVLYYPSFTREGTAIADYFAPARIIIGERVPGGGDALRSLLRGIGVPIFTTSFEVAELTKLADNTFHALKVTFANEVGRVAVRAGIPPSDVFDLFLADTKLNLSESYLRPGGAFGGPCLPKDTLAFAEHAGELGIAAPLLRHILDSNALHTEFLIGEIGRRASPPARLLLIGLSFKGGTDDLRGSPLVAIAGSLIERGYSLSIYDPDVGYGSRAFRDLPPNVAAAVIREVPLRASWELIVVGKNAAEAIETASLTSPVFRIDRL